MLTVFGDPVLDHVYELKDPVIRGGKMLGIYAAAVPGGTTANVACAAARFGLSSRVVGRAAAGEEARIHKRELRIVWRRHGAARRSRGAARDARHHRHRRGRRKDADLRADGSSTGFAGHSLESRQRDRICLHDGSGFRHHSRACRQHGGEDLRRCRRGGRADAGPVRDAPPGHRHPVHQRNRLHETDRRTRPTRTGSAA